MDMAKNQISVLQVQVEEVSKAKIKMTKKQKL